MEMSIIQVGVASGITIITKLTGRIMQKLLIPLSIAWLLSGSVYAAECEAGSYDAGNGTYSLFTRVLVWMLS